MGVPRVPITINKTTFEEFKALKDRTAKANGEKFESWDEFIRVCINFISTNLPRE